MADTNTGARPTEYMGSLIALFHNRRFSSGSIGGCFTIVPSGSMIPSGVKDGRRGGTSSGWPGQAEDAAAQRNLSMLYDILGKVELRVRRAGAAILDATRDGRG